MIDATKSPVPAWKRYGLMVLVAVLALAAFTVIWTKELHHSLPGSAHASSPPASTSSVLSGRQNSATTHAVAPTTVPGPAPSGRDPFG